MQFHSLFPIEHVGHMLGSVPLQSKNRLPREWEGAALLKVEEMTENNIQIIYLTLEIIVKY